MFLTLCRDTERGVVLSLTAERTTACRIVEEYWIDVLLTTLDGESTTIRAKFSDMLSKILAEYSSRVGIHNVAVFAAADQREEGQGQGDSLDANLTVSAIMSIVGGARPLELVVFQEIEETKEMIWRRLVEAKVADAKALENNKNLLHAAKHGDAEQLARLLAEGGDLEWKAIGEDASMLGWAAARGHLDCVQLLLDAGADVTVTDDGYTTPLEAAIERNHDAVVNVLLQPSVDAGGGSLQTTVLHWLASTGCVRGIQLLLGAGADPNVQDDEGRTPAEWADEDGHTEAAALLRAAIPGIDSPD
jgi:ankyrin repeat protein